MKNTTLNQARSINIKLGTYSNDYIPGTHNYHNLIPETKTTSFTTAIMDEHEFEVYYPKVTPRQIREAIQTGFNIIDPLNNMDYAYGDLIKQILAFIGFAHHFNLIDDQETETYLAKLDQINENYYFIDPESNDLDLEIALDTIQITTLKPLSYTITFNY